MLRWARALPIPLKCSPLFWCEHSEPRGCRWQGEDRLSQGAPPSLAAAAAGDALACAPVTSALGQAGLARRRDSPGEGVMLLPLAFQTGTLKLVSGHRFHKRNKENWFLSLLHSEKKRERERLLMKKLAASAGRPAPLVERASGGPGAAGEAQAASGRPRKSRPCVRRPGFQASRLPGSQATVVLRACIGLHLPKCFKFTALKSFRKRDVITKVSYAYQQLFWINLIIITCGYCKLNIPSLITLNSGVSRLNI